MKKILSYTLFILALALPAVSMASTASVSTSGNYIVGHTYTVSVVIDPQSSKIYTSKLEIKYPANLLEVTGFSFAGNSIPLSQPGYDSIDNTAGLMVKTAGFSSGITSLTTFGTITLYAKASGSGNLTVTSDSQLLDANNQNTFGGATNAGFIIKASSASTATTNTVQNAGTSNSSTIKKTTVSSSTVASTSSTSSASNTAAVVNAIPSTPTPWSITIIFSIVFLIIGFILGRKTPTIKI